jgi:hypothetical protein
VLILRIAVAEARARQRRQRPEIAAGGMAEHADAVGRDVEVLGIAAHELDAGQHVLHRMRKRLLSRRGEPVADREQRDAPRREILAPVLELAAHALHPAAAMHADQCRERPRPLRQVQVARKRNAVMRRVGHARPYFEFAKLFGRIHPDVPFR